MNYNRLQKLIRTIGMTEIENMAMLPYCNLIELYPHEQLIDLEHVSEETILLGEYVNLLIDKLIQTLLPENIVDENFYMSRALIYASNKYNFPYDENIINYIYSAYTSICKNNVCDKETFHALIKKLN